MKTVRFACTSVENPTVTTTGTRNCPQITFEPAGDEWARCSPDEVELYIYVDAAGLTQYEDYEDSLFTAQGYAYALAYTWYLQLPCRIQGPGSYGSGWAYKATGKAGPVTVTKGPDAASAWHTFVRSPQFFLYSKNSEGRNDTLYPWTVYGEDTSHPPYFEFTFDEGAVKTTLSAPAGYISRAQAITFKWATAYENYAINDYSITSLALEWKDGSDGSVNSIALSTAATSYTLASGTLPLSDAIYWRIACTTSEGDATSDWNKLWTREPKPTVKAISPDGLYLNSSAVNRFTWEYSISTGTAQSSFTLRWRQADQESGWSQLNVSGYDLPRYDVAPGTLPSGQLVWSVAAANRDGVYSDWSNELPITVIGPPATPEVTVQDDSPRPLVTWASSGQQAYQIQIGDYDSGLQFGAAKSFRCPEYLSPGYVDVRVRTMNKYNLWSKWATTGVTVVNASASVVLQFRAAAQADGSASLLWSTPSAATAYHVYRNGIKIAELTDERRYTDCYAIGTTEYFVRAVYADYSYTDSDTVSVQLSVKHPMIRAIDSDGDDWIELRYTSDSLPAIQTTDERELSLMQYSAATYPVPEASKFRRRTYTVSAAFRRGEEPQFEALLGHVVCVKDQYGNRIVGVMSSSTRAQNVFYTTYTAVVSEVEQDI